MAGSKIKINGGALVDDVHDTGANLFYIATGLDPDTNYCAEVLSYDDSMPPLESAYSSAVCATTTGDAPVPNNLALASNGSTVTVLSEPDPVGTPKGALINGDRTGGTSPTSGGQNYVSSGDPAVTPQWAAIDLGSAKSFSEVDIIGSPNGFGPQEPVLQQVAAVFGFSDFKFQTSDDGSTWTDRETWSSNVDQWRKRFFSPITARYGRVLWTNTAGVGLVYATEIEIWETGKNPVNIISMGNSRGLNSDNSWTRRLQRLLNHNYSVQSIAIGGLDLAQILVSSQLTDLAAAHNPNASDNVVMFLDCVNDFAHSRALADVKADFTTICGLIRAAGYKLVIGTTVKPTSSFVGGSNATNLDAMNVWTLANAGTLADACIDIAAESVFSDPETPSSGFMGDKIHFSEGVGAPAVAALIAAAIDPWYTF